MREFARLYAELDETTATNRKLEALQNYFASAIPENAAWAVYFLAGAKPRQVVPSKLLRQFAMEYAGLDEWLFDECYNVVGDLAETIAHILPPATRQSDIDLASWVEQRILPLRGADPALIRSALFGYWNELTTRERFLLIKLIGGSLRVGVSKLLVTRALSAVAGIDSKLIAQRLMGFTNSRILPNAAGFRQLIAPASEEDHSRRDGQPYPFFLAHQLQQQPDSLGDPARWQVEWKYDGMRAQLVRRQDQTWLWSRGEDLITERFPEIASIALPKGTVIDGEILIWHTSNIPASFAQLQQRIGRKTLSAKMLMQSPAILLAYDLLELDGIDIRHWPQQQRRTALEQLVKAVDMQQLKLAPLIHASDWSQLAMLHHESRARGVEGMMLKAADAAYGVGRTKDVGTWWKWKVDPYSIDAVLIYAQAGHGRRAALYTDYTFAVWDEASDGTRALVPFAKAYSGLTDAEIAQVDNIIRKTTVEKFGPVRSVRPSMVFEIGFEGIARSNRHKIGIAVRFPRILRWRTDKKIEDADTLEKLKALLAVPV